MSLYQELDNLSDKTALVEFRKNLIDRFGQVPYQVEDLFLSMELRWIAREIGFEKLVFKAGKMIGYFVTNQDSPYYQSPRFTQVLKYIQSGPTGVNMSEKNNKLRLVYNSVTTMQEAIENLQSILQIRD